MELVKIAEQNKKYFSEDFIKGFDTGVYIQYQRDKEEKTGKWVKKYRGNYSCSVCGAWYKTTDEYGNIIDSDDEMKSNHYCSNCGARMVNTDE